MNEKPSRSRSTWMPAVLVLAGLGAYAATLHAPLIFDGVHAIGEDRSIRSAWPPWESMLGSNRPLFKWTLALNYALGGLDVVGYHAVNIAIHVAAALLLFGVVRRTLLLAGSEPVRASAPGLALTTALLWLLHPLQTQAVTYLYQRSESLMGLAYLGALYALLRRAQGGGRPWSALCVLACTASFATKEVGVSAPLVLLLFDRTFLSASFGEAWRARRGLYAALAVIWSALFLVAVRLTLFTEGASAGFGMHGVSPISYLLTQPEVILHYVRLALWPDRLCLDYGWPAAQGLSDALPAALVVVLALAAVAWATWRRSRTGFLGAAFFLILAPTSSFMPIRDLAAEHRMYLPLAALVPLLVLAAQRALRALGLVRYGALLAAVCAAALGWRTVERNRDYADAVSIWRTVTEVAPGNARGHANLGVALQARGEGEEALREYRRALALDPDQAEARNNLGMLLLDRGRLDEAIEQFRAALVAAPDYVPAHCNLGPALYGAGRTEEALLHFRRAVELAPSDPVLLENLGKVLAHEGQPEEATRYLRRALALRPGFPEAHNDLGIALSRLGRAEESAAEFRAALAARPDYAAAHCNLGLVLADRGSTAEAAEHFRRALESQPLYPAAHLNLARALLVLGQREAAREHLRLALDQDPRSAEASALLRQLEERP